MVFGFGVFVCGRPFYRFVTAVPHQGILALEWIKWIVLCLYGPFILSCIVRWFIAKIRAYRHFSLWKLVKFIACLLLIAIWIVVSLVYRVIHWTGQDHRVACLCENQCEGDADGFIGIRYLIPGYFSCVPDQLRRQIEQEEMRKYAEIQEKQREERLQKLYNSNICDPGWIPVEKGCLPCNIPQAVKVSESDCLKCNQFEELRIYDAQSGACKPKQ